MSTSWNQRGVLGRRMAPLRVSWLLLVAISPRVNTLSLSRRAVLGGGGAAAGLLGCPSTSRGKGLDRIADRMAATLLPEPPVKQRSELSFFSPGGLVDDLYFPDWMAGDWEAVTTLRSFEAPLGARFLSGPSGLRTDVAEATIAEQRAQVGTSVGPYPLRWLSVGSSGGTRVVEDRAFNQRSRLNAFAGREVVRGKVEYVDVGGANRLTYGEGVPLPTTLVRFKGRAVQKTFSNNRAAEVDEVTGTWTGFEFTRTLFARTDVDQPPVVTDTQVITQLERPALMAGDGDDGSGMLVRGRIRIADYLTPNDSLFFDARQRAVTLSDYDAFYRKLAPGSLQQRENREEAPPPSSRRLAYF